MTQTPKTLVIADDHAFTLTGMAQALSRDGSMKVVGTAPNGIEAIAMIKQHQPDCAILDYVMPGATGLEVMLEARRWSPKTRFVVITGTPVAQTVQSLLNAGVNGMFVKTTSPEEIYEGICQVLEGEDILGPELRTLVTQSNIDLSLTAREIEVLHAVARGQSNPQISASLGISPKTVDSHRTSLMRKLGVNSTAALLVRAMKNGLIDVSSDI